MVNRMTLLRLDSKSLGVFGGIIRFTSCQEVVFVIAQKYSDAETKVSQMR